MKIFVHIGLHKTATTFLQQSFFPELMQQSGIHYNPAPLSGLLREIFLLNESPDDHVLQQKKIGRFLSEKRLFEETFPDDRLIFSSEKISQFDFCQQYEKNADLLKSLLPDVEIILFLRFQPDWLLSLYKQAVASGDDVDIGAFFNFDGENFKKPEAVWNSSGLLTTDALGADWAMLVSLYAEHYGKNRVRVFFFENFQQDSVSILTQLARFIGCELPRKYSSKTVNASLSAEQIDLYLKICCGFRRLGLGGLIHTSQKEFKRRVAKLRYQDSQTGVRSVIGKVVGRLVYVLGTRPKFLTKSMRLFQRYTQGMTKDRDLLTESGMRYRLETFYRDRNQKLLTFIDASELPEKYIRAES